MVKSTKEIADQLSKAQEWSSNGESAVSGMTYEEGVENALRWVLGETDEVPIEIEYDDNDEK